MAKKGRLRADWALKDNLLLYPIYTQMFLNTSHYIICFHFSPHWTNLRYSTWPEGCQLEHFCPHRKVLKRQPLPIQQLQFKGQRAQLIYPHNCNQSTLAKVCSDLQFLKTFYFLCFSRAVTEFCSRSHLHCILAEYNLACDKYEG